MSCPFEIVPHKKGLCWGCAKPVPKYSRKWCHGKCDQNYWDNHIWGYARNAAIRRDGGKCITCGSRNRLEVNHITPRLGKGYRNGCIHHLDGLETLCHTCHLAVTAQQRRNR